MSHEIPQARYVEAWSILQREGGIHVLPKRKLVIPRSKLFTAVRVVGVGNIRRTHEDFRNINDFLLKIPIADRFGGSHLSRFNWSHEMMSKLGSQIFKELYLKPNQLRTENMLIAKLALEDLQMLIEKNHHSQALSSELNNICSSIDRVFSGYHPVSGENDGKQYNDRDLDGKLAVVQFMEDCCIEGLGLFSR